LSALIILLVYLLTGINWNQLVLIEKKEFLRKNLKGRFILNE